MATLVLVKGNIQTEPTIVLNPPEAQRHPIFRKCQIVFVGSSVIVRIVLDIHIIRRGCYNEINTGRFDRSGSKHIFIEYFNLPVLKKKCFTHIILWYISVTFRYSISLPPAGYFDPEKEKIRVLR